VPIKLLHEGEGHVVTVELKTGEMYRGTLVEAEDNMNCELRNISFTARNGSQSKLERVYIRGSNVRFVVLPDMLKNAPMFKRIGQKAPSGSLVDICVHRYSLFLIALLF
jgi:small nuclear ribonucleoprotein D3